MRTTASYDLFPDAPSERAMARARYLVREGRVSDAESAYRELLKGHPDLKACWAEYFELLRSQGRPDEALHLAEGAAAQFGAAAFPSTLKGAALVDLERYREALTSLEQALEHDPDLAIAWHELGLAAYRLGDRNRALLALDRAFALEPHSETLKLRGRILREAGRFQAAEVAFEGAAQSAEHDEQRDEAEREIITTRRYAFYAPRRPHDLSPAERWFADTGTVVLASEPASAPPDDDGIIAALLELVRDRGWRFGQVVTAGPTLPIWKTLAERLGIPLAARSALDPGAHPLLVAPRPLSGETGWPEMAATVAASGSGLVFVLECPGDVAAPFPVDVIGVLTDAGQRRARRPNAAHALSEAQHPVARCAGRRLG